MPSMLGLTQDGDLIPLEFLDMRRSDFAAFALSTRTIMASFFSNPDAFAPFLRALAAALEAAKLRHVFGVCVRHRDSITSEDPGGSSMETNHPNQRWLRLDPMAAFAHKFDVIAAKFAKGEVCAALLMEIVSPFPLVLTLVTFHCMQSTPTFWSFPLRCQACLSGPTEGFCAECGCGGGWFNNSRTV